jgi:hypothetical protein
MRLGKVINLKTGGNNFEYWKTDIFHFSVQYPDVEGLAAKIVEHGGKQRMPVCEYYPGGKLYRMVYFLFFFLSLD